MTRLIVIIDEHIPALTYDFRHEFGGLSLHEIGKSISWYEAALLVGQLISQPGTRTYSSMRGHRFALSRDQLMMADLIDITISANRGKGRKPKPYDRGFDVAENGITRSRAPEASQEQVFRALERAGHKRPEGR